MKASNPGQLRMRAELQRKLDGQTNSYNGGIPVWQTYAVRRVALIPKASREQFRGQQLAAETTHIVRLRYLCDLETSHRLKINGRIFNISSLVNINEKSQWLELEVIEGG